MFSVIRRVSIGNIGRERFVPDVMVRLTSIFSWEQLRPLLRTDFILPSE